MSMSASSASSGAAASGTSSSAASLSPSDPSYAKVEPAVKNLIAALKSATPPASTTIPVDLSCLSASLYVSPKPSTGYVFDKSNVDKGLNQCSAVNTSTSPIAVDTTLRKSIEQALISADDGTGSVPNAALCSAFSAAGSAAMASLMAASVKLLSPMYDQTKLPSTLTSLITSITTHMTTSVFADPGKLAADTRLLSLDDFMARMKNELSTYLASASNWAPSAGVAQLAQYFATDYPDAGDALLKLGLGPWLKLSWMKAFADSDSMKYTTRAHANYALVAMASNAIVHVMNAYDNDQSNAECLALSRLKDAMWSRLSSANLDTSVVQSVLSRADETNADVLMVSREGDALLVRTDQTSNLRANAEADRRAVASARWLFFAWLLAYVTVLVASTYLIVTDQVLAFGVLAAIAVAVPTIDLLVRYLWNRRRPSIY